MEARMKNETGSAVVIVLLFLGIVSVVGAGLMLQTKLDNQFTVAVKSVDSLRDVASTAAGVAFRNIPEFVPDPPEGTTDLTDPIVAASGEDTVERNKYKWRVVFMGIGPSTSKAMAGEEIGAGSYGTYGTSGYLAFWSADGRGTNVATEDSTSRVQIAIQKKHRGK
jgi:hypothetical protein